MNSPLLNEPSLHGTRMLDAAKGVLVGLRGYTMAEAFSILCVAAEYQWLYYRGKLMPGGKLSSFERQIMILRIAVAG